MTKPKISSKINRRKFLTGLGATVAVVAAGTKLNSMSARRGRATRNTSVASKRQVQNAPTFLARFKELKPVGMVTRPSGTARMRLSVRPT